VRFLADSAEALLQLKIFHVAFPRPPVEPPLVCLLNCTPRRLRKSILHNSSHFHFHIILVVTSTRVQSIGPEVSFSNCYHSLHAYREFGG